MWKEKSTEAKALGRIHMAGVLNVGVATASSFYFVKYFVLFFFRL